MWTGGHNEVIPFTLKSIMVAAQVLPYFYRYSVIQGKIKKNQETFYPPRRLNINGEHVSYH